MLNARSVYNKSDNLNNLLNQIGPDLILISESWERERKRLSSVISRQFKSVSYYRKTKSPGGGCAIIYNENRFSISDLEIDAPAGVEGVWALCTPKTSHLKVKRIAVGSFYVSPRSQYKNETIEHIIQTIHQLRAKYDNEISFLCGGDFNHLDISDILDSYGALKSILSIPTRKSAKLEILLTDLHTMFHPPTTLPPLQVDQDKVGKDSDHNIVVFAPNSNVQYHQTRNKKKIYTRPLPAHKVLQFENDLIRYPWDEVFMFKNVDEQVEHFHYFLRSQLDRYFPEKMVRISHLDKKWFSPQLKQIHRSMQREFYKHRKSPKYKKLKFKKLKRRK